MATIYDADHGVKTCTKCKTLKSHKDFPVLKRKTKQRGEYRAPGSWCYVCNKENSSKYYYRNKERVLTRQKERYEEKRDEILAQQKDYLKRTRGYVTYRLDFETGHYWIGSTVNLKKRLILHRYRLRHGTHSEKVNEEVGNSPFLVTTLGEYNSEAEARAAELDLLHEHLGKELCLNKLLSVQIQCQE